MSRKKARRRRRTPLRSGAARAATAVRTVYRRAKARVARRRSGGRRGGGGLSIGGLVPAGTLPAIGFATGGFVGLNVAVNKLADKLTWLADPAKPWLRVVGKLALAIGGAWALRRFVSKTAGTGWLVGGGVSAGLDAYTLIRGSMGVGSLRGGLSGALAGLAPLSKRTAAGIIEQKPEGGSALARMAAYPQQPGVTYANAA